MSVWICLWLWCSEALWILASISVSSDPVCAGSFTLAILFTSHSNWQISSKLRSRRMWPAWCVLCPSPSYKAAFIQLSLHRVNPSLFIVIYVFFSAWIGQNMSNLSQIQHSQLHITETINIFNDFIKHAHYKWPIFDSKCNSKSKEQEIYCDMRKRLRCEEKNYKFLS